MSRYINRRTILAAVLVVALGTFLPPLINVSRFRPRVSGALSRALGRPVTIGQVHLRLFPRPGFDLNRVVVDDDPAFSAEPLLRADEVTASLRLASLWRGRLEIASLSLAYPSLNLVRARNGHWNLESLLERARRIPTAPTSKLSPESRPRFPYIEAKGGRINLKIGQEKTHYALSDASFALSLPSENVWQLRVSARPVRTDANLSDTGSVRLSGIVRRSSSLADTPLDLRVVVDRAQLGQLTTLIYGRDRGWRGTVNITASLRGTPKNLKLAGEASVDDFRRYDIATRGSLRLDARCNAAFSTTTQQFTDVSCQTPVGPGAIEARGVVTGVLPPQSYALAIAVQKLPANSLIALAQRMKKDLPDDLQASGSVSAAFDLRGSGENLNWAGRGTTAGLAFNSRLMKAPLDIGDVPFTLGVPAARGHRGTTPPARIALRFSPAPVDLGGAAAAKLQAWFAHDAYQVDLQGDAQISRLLQVAHAFGLRAPQTAITGLAGADLQVAGNWTGFAAPVITGDLHVRSATAVIPGLGAPLEISKATVHLAPDMAAVDGLAANFRGMHLGFTGWVQVPRACPAAPCPITFQLRADQLSTDELNRLLNPRAQKRPWYDLIGGTSGSPLLASLNASGRISATHLQLKTLSASRVSGDVLLHAGVLTVSNLQAQVLGGSTAGELRADFTGTQPVYTVRGKLQHAAVAAIAALTRDAWASGRVNADYTVTASGWYAAQLRDSATGTASFDWREGNLAHLSLTGAAGPLTIRHFQGELALADGEFTFKPSRMETPGGIYTVSGTASFDRELGLQLLRNKGESYDVTGTVEKPRIQRALLPTTQASTSKP